MGWLYLPIVYATFLLPNISDVSSIHADFASDIFTKIKTRKEKQQQQQQKTTQSLSNREGFMLFNAHGRNWSI